jgi:N-carbamoylputrescine amidase
MAFDDQGRSQNTVVEAGEEEGVYLAPFNLSELRDHRCRETMGNAFRRPHAYAELTDPAVTPPFVRVDRTGVARHSTRRHAGSSHAKDVST